MESIMGGNASVRRRPSLSTSRQRSMFTKRPMNTVFLPMGRMSLTTGREETDDSQMTNVKIPAFAEAASRRQANVK
jgi:hypothetical protein